MFKKILKWVKQARAEIFDLQSFLKSREGNPIPIVVLRMASGLVYLCPADFGGEQFITAGNMILCIDREEIEVARINSAFVVCIKWAEN